MVLDHYVPAFFDPGAHNYIEKDLQFEKNTEYCFLPISSSHGAQLR